MNWSLVKKDFMLLLKSPLTYIGVLSMVVILYITVSPYIKLYDDFQPDGETMEYSYDGNITDGYIPTPENERWEYVSQEMEAYLVSECEMSHEDAQKQMDEVLSKGWTVQEIRQFFIDEYGIVGFQSVWNMSAYKKADAGEVQQYLDSVFQEESYTSYLGRKYADYLGITSILFTISVFAILLMCDMRKSIYSFIHTKPISSRNYVLGKYIAGISMVLLFVVILTAIVDVVAVSAGNSYGYKTSLWDIWANIIMYDLPGILLTGCIMLFISILFKNVIPAIPAMLLYFIYANIGTLSSAEDYHYQVKPGAIFIRFPQLFTETEIPSGIVSNQIFLLILAMRQLPGLAVLRVTHSRYAHSSCACSFPGVTRKMLSTFCLIMPYSFSSRLTSPYCSYSRAFCLSSSRYSAFRAARSGSLVIPASLMAFAAASYKMSWLSCSRRNAALSLALRYSSTTGRSCL